MEPEKRLTILLCHWAGWAPVYEVAHINALARQLRQYLRLPFRLVLLTDQPHEGVEIEDVRPLPEDPPGLQLLGKVNCYRRIRFFDPEYTKQFGTEWVMSIDLDTLIRADITELVRDAMDHPFGLWIVRGRWASGPKQVDLVQEVRRGRGPERPYNGSWFMVRVGQHADVWNKFHPVETPRKIKELRWAGSDQCVISLLAPGAPTFGPEHRVYFFGQYLQERKRRPKEEAVMLHFAGRHKPWTNGVRLQAKDIWKDYMQWIDGDLPPLKIGYISRAK